MCSKLSYKLHKVHCHISKKIDALLKIGLNILQQFNVGILLYK